MSKTSARIMHTTPNGLGNPAESRPTPDFLQAARNRRTILENSIRFFLEDHDEVAAHAAMEALNELNAQIARLEAASRCPVCGRAADHDWQECAEEDYREWRAAQADRAALLSELRQF